jgi:hypothetical protein
MMFVRAARDLEQRLLRAVVQDTRRRRGAASRAPVIRREPAGRTAAGRTRAA